MVVGGGFSWKKKVGGRSNAKRSLEDHESWYEGSETHATAGGRDLSGGGSHTQIVWREFKQKKRGVNRESLMTWQRASNFA